MTTIISNSWLSSSKYIHLLITDLFWLNSLTKMGEKHWIWIFQRVDRQLKSSTRINCTNLRKDVIIFHYCTTYYVCFTKRINSFDCVSSKMNSIAELKFSFYLLYWFFTRTRAAVKLSLKFLHRNRDRILYSESVK